MLARLAIDFLRVKRVIRDAKPSESHGAYDVAITDALAGPVAWGIGGRRMLLPGTAYGLGSLSDCASCCYTRPAISDGMTAGRF